MFKTFISVGIDVGADSGSDVRCYGKVLLGRIELPDYIYDED